MKCNYKNILVIKWGALGDLVAGTPAIKALRDNFPDARITLLTNELMKQIIPPGFLVDEHITVKTNRNKVEDSLSEQFSKLVKLRSSKFDLAVNLRWTSERAALITYLSGAKTRISSGPRKMMWPYTIKIEHPLGRYHEIDRNLDIVKALGITVKDPLPVLFISEEDKKRAEQFFESNSLLSENTICIHPGASRPNRAWPPERFGQIGKMLADKFGSKILITWGRGEEKTAAVVKEIIGENGIISRPTETIGQLSALIGRCSLFFSNCTGPMNVAVAVRTPVVALLGSSDVTDWGAYGEANINIKSPLVLEHYSDEDERKAMDQISVEHVWEIISRRYAELLSV